MNCPKCNAPINEGEKFCSVCGAPVVDTTMGNDTVPTVTETAFAAPVKRPRKTVGVVIAAVALLLVAAIVVSAVTFGRPLFRSMFLSPEDHYREIELSAIDDGLVLFSDMMDTASENYASEGKVSLKFEISDEFLTLLESLTGEDIESYIGDVRYATLNMDVAQKGNAYGTNISLSVQDTELIAAEILFDTEDNAVYLTIPGIMDDYVKLDVGFDADYFALLNSYTKIYSALSLGKKERAEFARLLELAFAELDSVEKKDGSIKVDKVVQDCTVFETVIDQDILADMLLAVVEGAADSDILSAFLYRYLTSVESVSGESFGITEDEFYTSIKDGLLSLPEEIEYIRDEEFTITYTLYANAKDEIIGRTIRVQSDELYTDIVINLLTAQNGRDYAFEYSFDMGYSANFAILGEGTKNGDKFTGEMSFEVQNISFVDVELEDCVSNMKTGRASGTVTVRLGKAVGRELASYVNGSLASLLTTLEIKATFDSEKTAGFAEYALRANNMDLFTISMQADTESDYTPMIPANADIYDGDMDAYGEEISETILRDLFEKLEEAGFPIKNYINNIFY